MTLLHFITSEASQDQEDQQSTPAAMSARQSRRVIRVILSRVRFIDASDDLVEQGCAVGLSVFGGVVAFAGEL